MDQGLYHSASSDNLNYQHQHHQPQQPPNTWPSNQLLHPHNPAAFQLPGQSNSPTEPSFPSFYQHSLESSARSPSSALSLNLSSLSVASSSSSSLPSPLPSTSATRSPISPVVPTTPNSTATPQQPIFGGAQPGQPFQYSQQDPWPPFDGGNTFERRPPGSSRSNSSSEHSVRNKRSFTTTPLSASVEEGVEFDGSGGGQFDEIDMGLPDESPASGSEPADDGKPMDGVLNGFSNHLGLGAFSVLGKPPGTNNFVTKLYQMISDPKSAHFISWTELGTSFVVSSVGEFSRSILGSHFKHNNFSSFVRQLNMYGFHKINRTPRAQRTSTDAQTWEFSHHKFLRGRPDLLEGIKRKALEPDPAIRQRVELPAEVAMQLAKMHTDHQQVVRALQSERAKVEKLSNFVKVMYDCLSSVLPAGSIPVAFPPELLEQHGENHPPIFITSPPPSDALFNHPQSFSSFPGHFGGMSTISPGSSPTSPDFPFSHQHHSHLPHLNNAIRYDSTAPGTPLPSPSHLSDPSIDYISSTDHHQGRPKRQRLMTDSSSSQQQQIPHYDHGIPSGSMRKLARARSDSAPLGMQLGSSWETSARPRSGTALTRGQREDSYGAGGHGAGGFRSGLAQQAQQQHQQGKGGGMGNAVATAVKDEMSR